MKKKSKQFMAVSKLIGVIIGFLSVAVIIYAMTIMAVLNNLDALTTLIGGVFGLGGTYVGFYLLMAKAEHIEDKKNAIKKELELIRKDGITSDEHIREDELKEELIELDSELDEIKAEEIPTTII